MWCKNLHAGSDCSTEQNISSADGIGGMMESASISENRESAYSHLADI